MKGPPGRRGGGGRGPKVRRTGGRRSGAKGGGCLVLAFVGSGLMLTSGAAGLLVWVAR